MKTTSSYGRGIIGVIIVVLGVSFLLKEFGLLHFSLGDLISTWWPMAVVALGVVILANNPQSFTFPLLVIFAGILLQFQQFDYITVNIWNIIWPTALVAFGLSLLFERSTKKQRPSKQSETPKTTSREDTIAAYAIFSGAQVRNTSSNFQGGDATAIFGGFELDLRDASIKDSATLSVISAFGGGDIIVPEGWRVEASGVPIFGGWENKTKKPSQKDAPTLYIRGTCIFGGISIGHKKH